MRQRAFAKLSDGASVTPLLGILVQQAMEVGRRGDNAEAEPECRQDRRQDRLPCLNRPPLVWQLRLHVSPMTHANGDNASEFELRLPACGTTAFKAQVLKHNLL